MMSLEPIIKNAARPGAVWLTSGFRGGGKTHTAVAIAEKMVKGSYPTLGKVVVVTNIIFLKRTHEGLIEEAPEGVFHIHTMKDLFPIVVQTLETYGREVLIVLILDEAQNFLGGDSNQTNASVMMKEFLGTIRKFRLMVWFLTPSAMSIGPAFRNYLNNPKYPGNLTAKFKKDLAVNKKLIASQKLDWKPEETIIFKNYDMDMPVLFQITVTSWTRKKEDIQEGEYCYDHEASATFYIGDGFDWNAFNRVVGGVSSIRVLDVIKDFYAKNCTTSLQRPSDVDAPKDYKIQVMRRAIGLNIDVKTASEIAGVPYSTARRWLKNHEDLRNES